MRNRAVSQAGTDAEELVIANKELVFQNEEKEKRAAELVIANIELQFQNEEKEKRAAELVIANIELHFQNEEKEKRAAELIVANEELRFQNDEKERKAEELVIANKELLFQNEEKGKRAAELITANQELAFQNTEKENRASELIIANKELLYQNEEKEKRAAELVIANKELAFQNSEKEKTEIERSKMLAHIVQRNKDLEQFSYIVSHNLRAPVANILGIVNVLQTIEMDLKDRATATGYLSTAARDLDKVIKDINTILELNQRVNEKREIVLFGELLNEIKRSFDNVITDELADIKSDFSAISGMITMKSYLHSIFFNLISNSIKYRQPGIKPQIIISSKLLEDKVQLTFKDNGLGIDLEKNSEKIFGLYNRFHNHVDGKGMGLYMVKTQVESLGGTITVSSEVNKGTEFRIDFGHS